MKSIEFARERVWKIAVKQKWAFSIRTNSGDMANDFLRTAGQALCYFPSLYWEWSVPNWFWCTDTIIGLKFNQILISMNSQANSL